MSTRPREPPPSSSGWETLAMNGPGQDRRTAAAGESLWEEPRTGRSCCRKRGSAPSCWLARPGGPGLGKAFSRPRLAGQAAFRPGGELASPEAGRCGRLRQPSIPSWCSGPCTHGARWPATTRPGASGSTSRPSTRLSGHLWSGLQALLLAMREWRTGAPDTGQQAAALDLRLSEAALSTRPTASHHFGSPVQAASGGVAGETPLRCSREGLL